MDKLTVRKVETAWLKLDPKNAHEHDAASIAAIKASLKEFGQVEPLVVHKGSATVLGGNGRLEAMRELGWEHAYITEVEADDAKAIALAIALNKTAKFARWKEDALGNALKELDAAKYDLSVLSFDPAELERLLSDLPAGPEPFSGPTLSERFVAPPFSVFDARQGYWRARKQEWVRLGIASEEGRAENLLSDSKAAANMVTGINQGTSIFDPVLCELGYTWFSKKGDSCLDPFAGGSVRGIVAAKLGRKYHGIDLRPEQVEANRQQALKILSPQERLCSWQCADSLKALDDIPAESYDLVLSCPPYADLEVYSKDPADLSTMPYGAFLSCYEQIIAKAVACLKQNRFAFWVVGEVREPSGGGFYRGFVPATIEAFNKAGARFYNEAILITAGGSLAMRAGRIFSGGRKLGKTHQNVLIFCKGSPTKAAEAAGDIEVWEPAEEEAL